MRSIALPAVPPKDAALEALPVGAAASPPAYGRPAPWSYRHRGALVTGLTAVLFVWPFGRLPLDALQGSVGGALVAAGVLLRLWSVRQIGGAAHRTTCAKAKELVDWGPFSLSRNPIYLANLLLYSGFGVLAGLAWLLPVLTGALFLQYVFTVRYEESFLQAAFATAYAKYCASTPRWLGLCRWRSAPADRQPYPLARLLRRERGVLLFQVPAGLAFVALRVLL